MPLQVSRLRRWFALAAIALSLVVAGVYFYARWRARNALQEVPGQIGIEVQQSAQGFTVSRSEQGRTLFKIQASKAVQFKQGGRAELHDVTITLYGRDSSRFDQVHGEVFEYDPQSGDVTAKGEVEVDLEANPEGLTKPDQAAPKELKNPIHLKTSGLLFNQKTGNASTKEKVEFRIAQASGSAVGVSYVAADNVLTLESQVNVVVNGPAPVRLTAVRGTIAKNPREVMFGHQPARRAAGRLRGAGRADCDLSASVSVGFGYAAEDPCLICGDGLWGTGDQQQQCAHDSDCRGNIKRNSRAILFPEFAGDHAG